ncbi:MAG: rRNA maturation RNase YbeY [Planctomycetota bacterium]|jgi:probable rRNA maturation factor
MNPDKQNESIEVQITNGFKVADINPDRLRSLVKAICRQFEVIVALVSIAIVDDEEIIRVNKEFLSHCHTTDVISFDLSDETMETGKHFELVVNGEQAMREAAERHHSNQAELSLYITHGLLHNLGFDDSTQEKATKMHETEDEILQQHGFDLVYNNG